MIQTVGSGMLTLTESSIPNLMFRYRVPHYQGFFLIPSKLRIICGQHRIKYIFTLYYMYLY